MWEDQACVEGRKAAEVRGSETSAWARRTGQVRQTAGPEAGPAAGPFPSANTCRFPPLFTGDCARSWSILR